MFFCHASRQPLCKLSRELYSSRNQPSPCGGSHRCPGVTSQLWKSSRCNLDWDDCQSLAQRLRAVQDRHLCCGADILGWADWKHHPRSGDDHARCALLKIPVSRFFWTEWGLFEITEGVGEDFEGNRLIYTAMGRTGCFSFVGRVGDSGQKIFPGVHPHWAHSSWYPARIRFDDILKS